MIYFTTFILALFLTQFACAQQQTCGDPRSPELLIQDEQQNLPIPATIHASHTKEYDNKNGLLSKTECSNIAKHYKHFSNVPSFPRIGGYYNLKPHSSDCGDCWNVTNKATHKFIYITIIDGAEFGYFNLSEEAFKLLNHNQLGKPIVVTAGKVPNSHCSHH
jgi:hypothetical protein